ncbi:restriction endonuclease subunit S [Francisella salimarina]|nr:restriction endonuclease subunit S [Francisella salimarina]
MSELYKLPAGWEWKKLETVLDVQNGYAFDSKLFNESKGMPLIRIRDLKNGYNTEVKFSGYYDEKFVVKKGDFLIGMDGDFICYVWKGMQALLNQRVCRLINFSEALEPKYVFYGINKYLTEIHRITSYVTVKHISSKQIKNIEFPLPPLAEQKRIVAKLDSLFEKIDKAIELHQQNITNTNTLMASTLDKTFKKLEGEYSKQKIESFSKVGTGVTPLKSRKDYYNGSINWITSKATGYDFVTEAEMLITDFAIKECRLKIYPKGTLVVALYGQGKTRGQVTELLIESATNQAVATIVVDKNQNNKYLKFFLKKSYLDLREKASGGTQANLNLTIMKNIEVPLPPLPIQQQTVEYLDSIATKVDKIKQLNEQKLESLKALKASILDKAFRGEL